MSGVYKALADPTRRRILQLLRERDMSAGELAEHFESTRPTLSRHFNVLYHADLVQREKQGNRVIYSLNLTVLQDALMGMMDMFEIEPEDRDERQRQETKN